jgi:hypothetical protein
MGQSSIIFVLIAAVTAGLLAVQTQSATTAADGVLAADQRTALARDAARAGLERAKRQLIASPADWQSLASDSAAWAGPVSLPGGGTADAEVLLHNYKAGTPVPAGLAPLDDAIDVRATGTYGDRSVVLKATLGKSRTDVGIPPALRKAITINQDLTLNGTVRVRALDPSANAGVHSNGTLDANGSYQVEGHGTYTTGESVGSGSGFRPNAPDPYDPRPVQSEAHVYLPSVDVASMRDSAHAVTPAPSGTFTHNTTLVDGLMDGLDPSLAPSSATGQGTASAPFTWFVDGSLRVNDDLLLPASATGGSGHVRVYVQGDLVLGGGASMAPTTTAPPPATAGESVVRSWAAANLPDGATMAIYVAGDIVLNGTVSVAAFLHTNGTVKINGGGNSVNVIGGLAVGKSAKLNGGNIIWYDRPSAMVRDPSYRYDVPVGIQVLDYLEWPGGA